MGAELILDGPTNGTERAIAKTISKLSLNPGDVVVVTDLRTAAAMARMRMTFPFFVPIVVAPGGLSRLPIGEAKDVLAQLIEVERMNTPEAPMPTAGGASA